MPQMQDPNFARTVVLLCDYGPDGAFGLVLNRPTDMPANRWCGWSRRSSRGNDLPPVDRRTGSARARLDPGRGSARRRRVPHDPGRAVPVVVAGAAARVLEAAPGAARASSPATPAGDRDSSTKSSRSRHGSSATSTSIWSSTSRRRRCGMRPSAGLARIRQRCILVTPGDFVKCRGKPRAPAEVRCARQNASNRLLLHQDLGEEASARGSFDWPSQNMACFRTAGFECVRATWISRGTPRPSAAGSRRRRPSSSPRCRGPARSAR